MAKKRWFKAMKNNSHSRVGFIFLISMVLMLMSGLAGFSSANAEDGIEAEPENPIFIGQAPSSSSVPTDQVIITYQPDLTRKEGFDPANKQIVEKLSAASGVSLQYLRSLVGDSHVFRLPNRFSTVEMQIVIENLLALPEIAYAEPDLILTHTLTPNDDYYDIQWHYFSPSSGDYGINAPAGWDITTGSASVVTAVLDTGITNHAEFVGRTVPGYDFITDIITANDANGRDNDPSDPGDWVSAGDPCYEGSFEPSSWHGTHTAGTVGAASDNSLGVAGINWQGKILPVRVLGKCGGYITDISEAIRWSAGLTVSGVPTNPNPAKVINLSLGGASSTCGTTMQNAINAAVGAGATVVVSAGNSNSNASGFTPANCSNVITVAATNRSGNKASYSNYGSTVEISAPGGDGNSTDWVVSTYNDGEEGPGNDAYAYMAGTSMSAPHVSGVASLLYSYNPSITPSEVLSLLQSNATSFPSGSSCSTVTCGSGIVNAGAALAALVPPEMPFKNFLPFCVKK